MIKSTIFNCPICREILSAQDRSYCCSHKHSFDVAKEGYLNLVLSNQKKSKSPGDSKEMILARKIFLNQGFYKPLTDRISEIIDEHLKSHQFDHYNLLDAGCGEGYYLEQIARNIVHVSNINLYGVDVSKDGVREAAKRKCALNLAVASVYDLPVNNKSLDCLVNVFAPSPEAEFFRVLNSSGILILVRPGAKHLLGLKTGLYANPYLNEEDKIELAGFIELQKIRLCYDFVVRGREDILSLVKMTPYYWSTTQKDLEQFLNKTEILDTNADFIITVLCKIENDN